MPAKSGVGGQVQIGSSQLEITRWSLDYEVETSRYGYGGWKKTVPGVRGISGSFESVDEPPDPGTLVQLQLKEGGQGGKTWSGSAVIKKVTITVVPDTGEVIKYAVDFEGTGEWTET